MPQSLSRILVHLIFSTKDRSPVLTPEISIQLYPYAATVLRDMGCPALQVGGHTDHLHLLFGLSRTLSIAETVEHIKTTSSKWLKTKSPALSHFHWQLGYGSFSIGSSQADDVIKYITNQSEHHRKMTFQEEYRKFLERYQVPYDERYVWD
ncbi:IS200/IS605 family transposase [Pedosphaera parvula]|uniref:Transposase n=1 Tax=Pedosphaera parvula (strain Ellin514) TaxID=320771 RepID=B9XIR0_PEDPL|nr:IS200/IS605 family transposase [Pedosphaera parvula]EEF60323.1 transposase [Pedosphaera parvula Ellin514]